MEPVSSSVSSSVSAGSEVDASATLRALRKHIAEGVQHAQKLAPVHARDVSLHECLLFLQKALVCLSDDPDELWLDGSVQIDWSQFGRRIKRKRVLANLGQKQLAELVDISEGMIRAIESGQRRPSREVLLRLLAAPPLGLRLEDIALDSANDGVVPTSWLAPHYNPSQMISEMVEQLNSAGGSLEQTTAYLDYQSAKDWLDLASSSIYLDAFSKVSALDQVAQRVASESESSGLDVIALGCGDAKREIKLVESLLQHGRSRGIKDVRLFLLDISHSLLTVGHTNAREALGSTVKSIVALHGNFHDLAKYPLFSARDVRTRTRVFTMLGCTLANLDNEVRFFRDTLSSTAAGDFFVTDFTNAYAPAEQPDRIRQIDPLYVSGMQPGHRAWLVGPLQRYVRGLRDVEFVMDLNTDCSVRGSYELTYVANVTTEGSPARRRFAVFRVKRYDADKLEDCLSRSGWQPLERLAYGNNSRSHITLGLLRRTSAPAA